MRPNEAKWGQRVAQWGQRVAQWGQRVAPTRTTGWHQGPHHARYHHYPGYHPTRAPLRPVLPRVLQRVSQWPDRVRQASFGYSQSTKIPNCLKLPLFDTFLRHLLENVVFDVFAFFDRKRGWFLRKVLILHFLTKMSENDTFRDTTGLPLVYDSFYCSRGVRFSHGFCWKSWFLLKIMENGRKWRKSRKWSKMSPTDLTSRKVSFWCQKCQNLLISWHFWHFPCDWIGVWDTLVSRVLPWCPLVSSGGQKCQNWQKCPKPLSNPRGFY